MAGDNFNRNPVSTTDARHGNTPTEATRFAETPREFWYELVECEMTRLPNFLIIGAMKAGTTTLYDDLRQTPGVYLPPEKEPEDLAFDAVLTDAGHADYARKFKAAAAADLCGEASTAYAKAPEYGDVPGRVLELIGPQIKVIYILRDPIKRVQSHYRHLVGLGLETRPFDQAVREDPRFVDTSRYSYQLALWQDRLAAQNIHVLTFEDYLSDRTKHLGEVRSFLGLSGAFEVGDSHLNASDGKRIVPQRSSLRALMTSNIYQYGIKPLLPTGLKSAIKSAILPNATKAEGALGATLSAETRAYLHNALKDDALASGFLKAQGHPDSA